MKNVSILVVPCCEKGKGGGHLSRCIKLIKDLHASGKEAYLYVPEEIKIDNLLKSYQFDKSFIASEKGILKNEGSKNETAKNEAVKKETQKIDISKKNWELIILDRYNTPQDELNRWKTLAPVIGIDEGGPERDEFDFLIDILIPENFEKPTANITSCGLLDLPQKTKASQNANNKKVYKILISFGHEDAAGLALKTIKKLSKKYTPGMEITLLKGALNDSKFKIPDYIKVLDCIPNLADHLYEYDLVITHYGITAYEALYAGTNVLLDHPSHYHKKIAKAAEFMDIKNLNLFLKTVANRQKNALPINSAEVRALAKKMNLTELINSLSMQTNRRCPVCGKEKGNVSIARFPDRTYRRCSNCGIIYMNRTCPQPVEYKREYFFESYKKQYGKTYLEDFPNLLAMAKRRLKIISKISSQKDIDPMVKEVLISERVLLDIGCAYGPFLVAAREDGFSPAGIEPAQDAARYVQKSLGIPAIQGFFPNCPLPTPNSPPYDVITLWFVIEHFNDCLTVLPEIKKILKPGGIFAFSTPSSAGVSGRKSLLKFLENSPADHYTIWSPKMCKKALAIAGFQVKKTVITGHHPERFSLLGKLAKSKKSPLYWLLYAFSYIFRLGDTFEVYAQLL